MNVWPGWKESLNRESYYVTFQLKVGSIYQSQFVSCFGTNEYYHHEPRCVGLARGGGSGDSKAGTCGFRGRVSQERCYHGKKRFMIFLSCQFVTTS